MVNQMKRSSRSMLKIVTLGLLFSQSPAQADLLSNVSGFFSSEWQNNKAVIATASIGLAALGLYSYYSWCNRRQPTNAIRADVHIGIPISDNHLGQLKKQLLLIQHKIKEAANKNGYYFETRSIDTNGLHISLENVQGVEQKDVARYESCVAAFAKRIGSIDLSSCLAHAKFEIFETGWGVLQLPMTNNCILNDVATSLRKSLKHEGLKVGQFDDFKAHISLGKFTTYQNKPKPHDASWVPKITVKIPSNQCTAKNIVLSVRRKEIKNQKMNVVTSPDHVYQLAY